MTNLLKDRIVAHRSAPDVYDPPTFEQMSDRIEELEATLRKLEYWFDTDHEILDVIGNNEKADHMRKIKLIRDTLTGGNHE